MSEPEIIWETVEKNGKRVRDWRDVTWVRQMVQREGVGEFVPHYWTATSGDLRLHMKQVIHDEIYSPERSFDDIYDCWLMREAAEIMDKGDRVKHEQMSLSARAAFYIAHDLGIKGQILQNSGINMPIEYAPNIGQQMEDAIRETRDSPKHLIEKRHEKIFAWLDENKEDALAFGRSYDDAKLVIDALPAHDGLLTVRFHSVSHDRLEKERADMCEMLGKGFCTDRKLTSPRRPSFNKATPQA